MTPPALPDGCKSLPNDPSSTIFGVEYSWPRPRSTHVLVYVTASGELTIYDPSSKSTSQEAPEHVVAFVLEHARAVRKTTADLREAAITFVGSGSGSKDASLRAAAHAYAETCHPPPLVTYRWGRSARGGTSWFVVLHNNEIVEAYHPDHGRLRPVPPEYFDTLSDFPAFEPAR